jgi:hypothetical protein
MLIYSAYTVGAKNQHEVPMSTKSVSPLVVNAPWQVNQQLTELGLSRDLVRDIAMAASAARADSLAVDPSFTPGMLSFIHGVRAMRLRLLPLGWRISRTGNVESTVNDRYNVQLFFQNVDRACGTADPVAVSGKGAAARNLVKAGQLDMFADEFESAGADEFVGKTPTVWMVCVSSDDESVRAEVSCPDVFNGNHFEGFKKRIFVIDESRAPDPSRRTSPNSEPAFDVEIAVTKKP